MIPLLCWPSRDHFPLNQTIPVGCTYQTKFSRYLLNVNREFTSVWWCLWGGGAGGAALVEAKELWWKSTKQIKMFVSYCTNGSPVFHICSATIYCFFSRHLRCCKYMHVNENCYFNTKIVVEGFTVVVFVRGFPKVVFLRRK